MPMKRSLPKSAMAAILALCFALATSNCASAASYDQVRFRTPSNRIHCMFVIEQGSTAPNGLACDIDQSVVKKPARPRPADCEGDWGQRFELGNDSDAGLECASDWIGSDDSEVLAYGTSIRRGKIVCHSEATGLTCKNDRGRGFFLSRDNQRIF